MSDLELNIEHHFSTGLYARKHEVKKGGFVQTHKHNYDHMSILAQGRALVTVDFQTRELVAPAVIEIKAGKTHRITAVEDLVWFCIHATDATTADEVEAATIMMEN